MGSEEGAETPLPYRHLMSIGFVLAVAAVSLFTTGCGGSSGSHVAQLGSNTTTTQRGRASTGARGASTSAASTTSQMLAYARCMRSHGVPTIPDPDSSGRIPKTEVLSARQSNPARFDSADRLCQHLLPSGGSGETAAEVAQDWNKFRKFARCMRSRGVSNWPDPTSRSTSDRRPGFNLQAVGLDPHSPQVRAKQQECARLSNLVPPAH